MARLEVACDVCGALVEQPARAGRPRKRHAGCRRELKRARMASARLDELAHDARVRAAQAEVAVRKASIAVARAARATRALEAAQGVACP